LSLVRFPVPPDKGESRRLLGHLRRMKGAGPILPPRASPGRDRQHRIQARPAHRAPSPTERQGPSPPFSRPGSRLQIYTNMDTPDRHQRPGMPLKPCITLGSKSGGKGAGRTQIQEAWLAVLGSARKLDQDEDLHGPGDGGRRPARRGRRLRPAETLDWSPVDWRRQSTRSLHLSWGICPIPPAISRGLSPSPSGRDRTMARPLAPP